MEDDEDEHNPSTFSRGKMPAAIEEEEVMELIWEKGPVIVSVGPGGGSNEAGPSGVQQQQHLFMEEDEMAFWLQLHYNNLINTTSNSDPTHFNLLYPPPPKEEDIVLNFPHFSHFPIRIDPPPAGYRPVLETTTHHNLMPAADMLIRSNDQQLVTLVSSSPGTSIITCSAIADPPIQPQHPVMEDRKGKALEPSEDDINRHWTEWIRSEPTEEAQRHGQGSVLTRRSQKSEVHNLSERKRRNRINEKIRTLKELIPGCNKSDKASILDDAIEYMKSLQMQIQMMMSVGYRVIPMMYPGIQQYMRTMGMGMGMNRPIVPYPNILPGSMCLLSADTNPTFSTPAFHQPQVSQPDPTRIQASDHTAIMLSLLIGGNPSQTQAPNFVSAYRQFLGSQQAQISSSQNQESVQPSDNNPSSIIDNPENLNTG